MERTALEVLVQIHEERQPRPALAKSVVGVPSSTATAPRVIPTLTCTRSRLCATRNTQNTQNIPEYSVAAAFCSFLFFPAGCRLPSHPEARLWARACRARKQNSCNFRGKTITFCSKTQRSWKGSRDRTLSCGRPRCRPPPAALNHRQTVAPHPAQLAVVTSECPPSLLMLQGNALLPFPRETKGLRQV